MEVYLKNYNQEKYQRLLLPLILGWGLSCLTVSSLGRAVSSFLFLAVFIFGIITLVKGRSAKNDTARGRGDVPLETFKKLCRLSVPVSVVLGLLSMVAVGLFSEKDFSTPYGIASFVSGFVLCGLFFFLPLYFRAFLRAAENNSTEKPYKNTPYRSLLRWRNLCALVLSFLVSYVMLFYALPYFMKSSEDYVESLDKAVTHDIYAVGDYKTEKLKDCKTEELLSLLPFNSELDKVSTAEDSVKIIYKKGSLSDKETKKTVVYNGTALFALIDDLREIDFTFGNESVTVYRKTAVETYEAFEDVLNDWFKAVTYPLTDDAQSEQLYRKITGKGLE